jgi:hypothetical protein
LDSIPAGVERGADTQEPATTLDTKGKGRADSDSKSTPLDFTDNLPQDFNPLDDVGYD